MVHHLKVNGATRLNGNLLTTEDVGIGSLSPDARLAIKTNYFDENTGLMLDAWDNTNIYRIKFFFLCSW